jgi:hypothetical protein
MGKKQYTTKQKMALAAKIMQRAVEISETTPHDVFVRYSPHVDWIDVDIHIGGWERNAKAINLQISFSEIQEAGECFNTLMAEFDLLMGAVK